MTTLSALANIDEGHIKGLLLTEDLYPPAALESTIEAFSAFCAVEVKPAAPGFNSLDITVRPEHLASSRQVLGEFLNLLLGLAFRACAAGEAG